MKHALASSRWLHRAPRCVSVEGVEAGVDPMEVEAGVETGPIEFEARSKFARDARGSGTLLVLALALVCFILVLFPFYRITELQNCFGIPLICALSYLHGARARVGFPFSDYIIPQFLKNVKRVLNIFYGNCDRTINSVYTMPIMSFCPYIRKFVNSSTDTSDYLYWSIFPFLFIPYYNRFLLFIYLFIKKNEKQRKNK